MTLREVPLTTALQSLHTRPPTCFITMARGQWDAMLSAAYDAGWVLIEVDDNEQPQAAYQRLREESHA